MALCPPPAAPALALALHRLPPRSSAALLQRLGEGGSLAACAAFYGIPPRAASVKVLRAALELAAELGAPQAAPPDAGEARWAEALEASLEGDGGPADAPLAPLAALCRRLRALAPAVREELEALERREAASPRSRREDRLRRLAVLALLALAGYLYLARPPEPEPRPTRPEPRSP